MAGSGLRAQQEAPLSEKWYGSSKKTGAWSGCIRGRAFRRGLTEGSADRPTAHFLLPTTLFVRHRRARRACEMDHFEALQAYGGTPAAEVRSVIIEGIAEFDEHVQGHEQPEQ